MFPPAVRDEGDGHVETGCDPFHPFAQRCPFNRCEFGWQVAPSDGAGTGRGVGSGAGERIEWVEVEPSNEVLDRRPVFLVVILASHACVPRDRGRRDCAILMA